MKKPEAADSRNIKIKLSFKKMLLVLFVVWGLSLLLVWYLTKNNFLFSGNKFPLLSPRLESLSLDTLEKRKTKLFTTLLPLKQEVLEYYGEDNNKVAFYVEDLNSGSWIGWQEREPFIAASLLKVPVAIGVMKKVDKGEWKLDTQFKLEAKYKDKYFGDLWKLNDGTSVSVEKLLHEMLQNSDNTAANLLFDKLTKDERDDVYYFVGTSNPEASVDSTSSRPSFNKLSSKDLANVFRALYNSTYLTRESSNYILDILTKTKFDKVISASIPEGTRIAHKIGNFYNNNPERPKNYHDCGITYLPGHPYLYCVMTDQFSAEVAQEKITSTGEKIYKYFDSGGSK